MKLLVPLLAVALVSALLSVEPVQGFLPLGLGLGGFVGPFAMRRMFLLSSMMMFGRKRRETNRKLLSLMSYGRFS